MDGIKALLISQSRRYSIPHHAIVPLLVAGAVLGAAGDALLRESETPAVHASIWIGLVAMSALALARLARVPMDPRRVTWLLAGVVFAAGLAWRDAPPLKLLALGCATLTFAIAACRPSADWLYRAGVVRYAWAVVLGAVHAWAGAILALADAAEPMSRAGITRPERWRRAAAFGRGLAIAAPLVAVFAALFMSADAVFAQVVANAVRVDAEWIASHVLLFGVLSWISTGYLRGFFELVFAVVLVVPILLAGDWMLDRRGGRDNVVFRSLAGLQIALVLAIAASAFQRLRLYYAGYGLTESRFYAMVLLVWIAAMLLWLAVTVLRGRRQSFAFGALASGLATVALLFAVNPHAVIARANVTRLVTADTSVQFDVAYATRLSADSVPVLVDALPLLPSEVRCPLARHVLRRSPPDRERSYRNWSWSTARASDAVRAHEPELRSMVVQDPSCGSAATRK